MPTKSISGRSTGKKSTSHRGVTHKQASRLGRKPTRRGIKMEIAIPNKPVLFGEKTDWDYIATVCSGVIKRNNISRDQVNEALKKVRAKNVKNSVRH